MAPRMLPFPTSTRVSKRVGMRVFGDAELAVVAQIIDEENGKELAQFVEAVEALEAQRPAPDVEAAEGQQRVRSF